MEIRVFPDKGYSFVRWVYRPSGHYYHFYAASDAKAVAFPPLSPRSGSTPTKRPLTPSYLSTARPSKATSSSVTGARRRPTWSAPSSRCRCHRCAPDSPWTQSQHCFLFSSVLNRSLRSSAEHRELPGAAVQSVGPVVWQHAADQPVRAQRVAGAKLRSVRTGLGSAGLQVSLPRAANGMIPSYNPHESRCCFFLWCLLVLLFFFN